MNSFNTPRRSGGTYPQAVKNHVTEQALDEVAPSGEGDSTSRENDGANDQNPNLFHEKKLVTDFISIEMDQKEDELNEETDARRVKEAENKLGNLKKINEVNASKEIMDEYLNEEVKKEEEFKTPGGKRNDLQDLDSVRRDNISSSKSGKTRSFQKKRNQSQVDLEKLADIAKNKKCASGSNSFSVPEIFKSGTPKPLREFRQNERYHSHGVKPSFTPFRGSEVTNSNEGMRSERHNIQYPSDKKSSIADFDSQKDYNLYERLYTDYLYSYEVEKEKNEKLTRELNELRKEHNNLKEQLRSSDLDRGSIEIHTKNLAFDFDKIKTSNEFYKKQGNQKERLASNVEDKYSSDFIKKLEQETKEAETEPQKYIKKYKNEKQPSGSGNKENSFMSAMNSEKSEEKPQGRPNEEDEELELEQQDKDHEKKQQKPEFEAPGKKYQKKWKSMNFIDIDKNKKCLDLEVQLEKQKMLTRKFKEKVQACEEKIKKLELILEEKNQKSLDIHEPFRSVSPKISPISNQVNDPFDCIAANLETLKDFMNSNNLKVDGDLFNKIEKNIENIRCLFEEKGTEVVKKHMPPQENQEISRFATSPETLFETKMSFDDGELADEHDRVREESLQLKKTLNQKETIISNLEKNNEKLKKENEYLHNIKLKDDEKIKGLIDENGKILTDWKQITEEKNKLSEEIEMLKGSINTTEEFNSKLNQERENIKNEFSSKITDLENSNTYLKSKYEDSKKRYMNEVKRLKDEIKAKTDHIKKLEDEIAKISELLRTTETDKQKALTECDDLRLKLNEEIKILNAKVSKLQEEKAKLEENLDITRREKEEALAECEDLRAKLEPLRKEVKEIKEENLEKRKYIEELELLNKSSKKEFEILSAKTTREIDELKLEVEELKGEVQNKEDMLRDQTAQYEASTNSMANNYLDLTEKMKEATSQKIEELKGEFETRIEELSAKLETQSKQYEESSANAKPWMRPSKKKERKMTS